MNGFFAAALQNIMGCEARLEILHAGENACLKKLIIRDIKSAGKATVLGQELHVEGSRSE